MIIEPLLNQGKIREAKILIVDDHEDGVALLQQMLQKAGYANVFATTDSRETVGMCEEIAADLLILDLNMPPPSGYDILDQLALRPGRDVSLPILVLTADITPMAKLKALSLGAKDFLTKPVEQVDLLLRVRNLLEMRSIYRQLEQSRTPRHSEESKSRAENTNEVLDRLHAAIECFDPALAARALRVSRWAFRIGKAAGLSTAEANQLELATRVYDIGMLAISRELRKSGIVNPEAKRLLRSHAVVVESILQKTANSGAGVNMAREIATGHHERWDGGGYPLGLNGEAIPRAARIAAVAETLDSLVHPENGDQPSTLESAVTEVTRNAGFAFDPDITEALGRVLAEADVTPSEVFAY
jgi:putative two-component system response regulator